MKYQVHDIADFLGLLTNYDEVTMPLGGALSVANLCQYFPSTIQRIPGLINKGAISNSDGGIPHAFRIQFGNNPDQIAAVITDTSGNVKLWNLSANAEITGTYLNNQEDGALARVWSSAFYMGAWYVANGMQAIQKITNSSTRVSIPDGPADAVDLGTSIPPIATFVETYLGRLYMAYGRNVHYTESLLDDYYADNILSIDEIPGVVTGLAINSPTSATAGIVGELIAMKATGLVKLRGDPFDANSIKDVVSAVVGSNSPHTWANTPIGLVFLGLRNDKYSVYFLPVGSGGEPTDIGHPLYNVLNDPINPLLNIQLSNAVYHDGKYKLFLNRNGRMIEVWLDVDLLARDQYSMGSFQTRSPKTVWYGMHTREAGSATVVTDDKKLSVFDVIAGTGTYFEENEDRTAGFVNATGNVLQAVLDIPLNVPPPGIWKTWDLLAIYNSSASNVPNNSVAVDIYSEGAPKGTTRTVTVGDVNKSTGVDIRIPITGTNGASVAGDLSARVKLTHTLNKQFDILHMHVQTLVDEEMRIRA